METRINTPRAWQEAIEQAHMAGQADAGVDPSYSNARVYALRTTPPDDEARRLLRNVVNERIVHDENWNTPDMQKAINHLAQTDKQEG